jgi:hypothetical protein
MDGGNILWSFEPTLPGLQRNTPISWVRLLPMTVSPEDIAASAGGNQTSMHTAVSALFVASTSGDLFVWYVDAHGVPVSLSGGTCSSRDEQSCLPHTRLNRAYRTGDASAVYEGMQITSMQRLGSMDATQGSHTTTRFLFLHGKNDSYTEDPIQASLFPPMKNLVEAKQLVGSHITHVHTIDSAGGLMQTYSLHPSSCDIGNDGLVHCAGVPVASSHFADSEAIVDIAYPTHDRVNSRFNVLGDDSVLLKYTNPNIVMVTTVSPPEASSDPSICDTTPTTHGSPSDAAVAGMTIGTGIGSAGTCKMKVTVIDTVSAKVVYRIVHENAVPPAHSTVVENTLVYTYWNTKVRCVFKY